MELTTEFMILVPLIVGLTQVATSVIGLNSRYAPAVALILGLGGAFFLGAFDVPSTFQGLIAALTASGLYSGAKATVRK